MTSTRTRLSAFTFEGVASVDMYVSDCATCGVVFGMTTDFEARRRETGASFYCPNGHSMVFKETTADLERKKTERERRLRESAEARLTHERDQRHAAERSAAAYKGVATRVRRRAANGMCPCCQRTFQNLARHVAGQHPDFVASVKS